MPRVIAITASYRRPDQLVNLLASLAKQGSDLAHVLVVDNAGDPRVELAATSAPLATTVITPGKNLGCGGGVACGLQAALLDSAVTHVWIFDDDAAATPGALGELLSALKTADADAAVPLVTDAAGRIGWFPGPLTQPAWTSIRRATVTPAEFRATSGTAPLRWAWAPWPSLLVSRRAIESVGLPRDDYWFQGEDLEWTLRISAKFSCVLASAAECRHFPPKADSARLRLKAAAMLQNNWFTGTRLAHGRRLWRHASGNVWRFLRAQRFAPGAFALVWGAFWRGAICGRPAGAAGGDALRRAWMQLV